jgi:hypothetical protein
MRESKEIKPLTSSRGVAAFIVVLFHLQATINELCDRAILPINFRTDHIGIISDGYIAVDFFFVLSGFIISRANGHLFEDSLRRADYGYFLTKRLGRLFALNVVTLVVLLPLEFLKYFINVGNTPAFADTNTVGAWFENLFLVQTWFLGHGPSWNTVAWSISAEWAAYILYPLLFVILVRCPAAVLTLVVGAAVAGLALLETISPSGTLSLTDHGAVLRCLCGFTLGVITEHASHSQPVRRAVARVRHQHQPRGCSHGRRHRLRRGRLDGVADLLRHRPGPVGGRPRPGGGDVVHAGASAGGLVLRPLHDPFHRASDLQGRGILGLRALAIIAGAGGRQPGLRARRLHRRGLGGASVDRTPGISRHAATGGTDPPIRPAFRPSASADGGLRAVHRQPQWRCP